MGFDNSYDYPLTGAPRYGLAGQRPVQFQIGWHCAGSGTLLVARRYGMNSYELYAQDAWKVKPTLTLPSGSATLCFRLLGKPTGQEVVPDLESHNGSPFGPRMQNGIPSRNTPSPSNWAGKANGKPGYYNWDHKERGPRIAFAWAPPSGMADSCVRSGKTSIRGGVGIVYDRAGQG